MTEFAKIPSLTPADATPRPAAGSASLRAARVTRAVVLFAVGIAIAFTAPLHEILNFNRWMLMAAFTLLGLATLFEHFVQRSDRASWPIAIRAALMFFAAIAVLLSYDSLGLTIVVAAWAVANAIVLFAPVVRSPTLRGQMLPAALLSLALAIAVVILRDDPVGVIGFFGVYTLICGVFLGISAFDTRATSGAPTQRQMAGSEPEPNDLHAEHAQSTTSSTESTR